MSFFFFSTSEIHQVFQSDLFKIRLNAARSLVRTIQTSLNPISSSIDDPLKLSAQVGEFIWYRVYGKCIYIWLINFKKNVKSMFGFAKECQNNPYSWCLHVFLFWSKWTDFLKSEMEKKKHPSQNNDTIIVSCGTIFNIFILHFDINMFFFTC